MLANALLVKSLDKRSILLTLHLLQSNGCTVIGLSVVGI